MNLIPPALRSARNRWLLIAGVWVALLVLGIGGFAQQEHDAGLDRTGLDTLYLTLQLLTLDYDDDEALNWRLEVARFVAPLVAASTVLQSARSSLQTQFARLRLRFAHDHVVVCGLDEVGGRLAAAFAADGRQVVAIEADPAAPGVSTAKAAGVTIVVGDPADGEVLGEARVDRASDLVVVGAADARNVEVVATARALPRPPKSSPLRCAVQLLNPELCRLLRDYSLQATGSARVEFFNVYELAARSWLLEWPPFGDGSRPPHLVLFGAGNLGSALAVAAAQRWREQSTEPLWLTIVDKEATARWSTLVARHPALLETVRPTILDMNLVQPSPDTLAKVAAAVRDRPTGVAVAFDNDGLTLSTALWAHEQLDDASVPVVMRVWTEGGLAALIDHDAPGYSGLHPFPVLDRACTVDVVTGGVREQLARTMHEDHVAAAGIAAHGLNQAWQDLSDRDRESSRRRADHLCNQLGSFGWDLVPLQHWGTTIALDPELVDRLAADDHERWRADRTAEGWRHGATRDDAARTNPLLLPWDELPEDARERNRDAVRVLPDQLARAGLELEPSRRGPRPAVVQPAQ
jgi:hypothetical protein